jgi:hypothetical protein
MLTGVDNEPASTMNPPFDHHFLWIAVCALACETRRGGFQFPEFPALSLSECEDCGFGTCVVRS